MFEDLKDPNLSFGINPNKGGGESEGAQEKKIGVKIIFFSLLILAILIMITLIGRAYVNYLDSKKRMQSTSNVATSTNQLPHYFLPVTTNVDKPAQTDDDNVQADKISFGSLYKKEAETVENKAAKVNLPLSVKNDVANYYEVARKIPLDSQIDNLNHNGFAIIDNPFDKSADNFFGGYNELISRSVPQLITDDFLIYYYQNKIKETFNDIKSGVFYDDLWNINKAFYDIANSRYKKTKLKLGDINDPLLEAERLEAAYFAVTLELLKPGPKQINTTTAIDDNKFTERDVKDMDFTLPDYLVDDVVREVKLIQFANRTEKSPVLLYTRDYRNFNIPTTKNAKQNNFSLAIKWLNSVFPLYHASPDCDKCLLDQNDWLVNFITSNLVAKDFADNQPLKNKWARIYKIVAYFSGLRKDLTYLQYDTVLSNQYGKGYQLENIYKFDDKTADKLKIAESIRNKVDTVSTYNSLMGSFDRQDRALKPTLGMRMLQDSFWPDDYIFSQLISPTVTKYTGGLDDKARKQKQLKNVTRCQAPKLGIYRCRPFSLDVMNLVEPIAANDYFTENTAYENYDSSVSNLGAQINNFNQDSWHENIYWNSLNILREGVYGQHAIYGPINSSTDYWRKRQDNLMLGTWVSLRLPADELSGSFAAGKGLSIVSEVNAYVEPNLPLINELIANTKMLSDMLSTLKIIKDVDYSSKRLAEFQLDLEKIRDLEHKEISGEPFIDTDQIIMGEIMRKYVVVNQKPRKALFKYNQKDGIVESVDGIKYLALIYQAKDKKILTVGPVFYYEEGGKAGN